MKHTTATKQIHYIWGVVCIAFVLFFFCGQVHDFAAAHSVNETVMNTLEGMGITDAQRSPELESETADGDGIIYFCYTSDSTELVFYFDGANGLLRSVDTYQNLEPDDSDEITTNAIPLTDAQREAESLAMAQMLLTSHQIGELRIDEIMSTQLWDRFIVKEYYEGQPTGTSVTVAWEGSSIMGAVPHLGTIFKKDAVGNIVPVNDGEKITEEQAIDAALEVLRETESNLDEGTTECELVIVSGGYCYKVFVQTALSASNGVTTEYAVLVNAYTGEILDIAQSV